MDAEIIAGTDILLAGSRVPNLPEEIASFWMQKRFAVNDDMSWRIGAGVRYNGDEVDGGALTTIPSVTLVDAMADVSFKLWDFSMNVTNLTDKEHLSECGTFICAPAPTRVILATASKRF